MRTLPLLLAAAVALPGIAQAQQSDRASQRLELAALAPVACVISTPSVGSQQNASFASTSSSSGQINITEFVDPENASSRGSAIELNLPLVCNSSHSVRVTSANRGLLRAGASGTASTGGFSEFLAYTVGLDWSGQSLELQTTNAAAALSAAQPGRGEMTIRITTPAGNGPLIAGQYSDSIVVEVQPSN